MRVRRGKRSVFGWAIAQLRKEPKRAPTLARLLLGPYIGARVWRAAKQCTLREGPALLARGERQCARLRARFVCIALRILEGTCPSRGRAMGPGVALGRLAGPEGISKRQGQRYLRALRRARALQGHQPPADRLPARLVGPSGWAYGCHDWLGELPRATTAELARWRTRAPRPAALPPDAAG